MATSLAGYKIGKTAQLTGISTERLRIWERRYEVVTPIRSEAGVRLYAIDDISRLKIIKKLIDSGDSISNIASLTLDELESRINDGSQDNIVALTENPIKVAVIGGSFLTKFSPESVSDEDIEIIGSYDDTNAMVKSSEMPKVDILIYGKSALQEENIQEIIDLMDDLNASHALIIYRFASQDTLNRLPKSKFRALRAPIDTNTIKDHCRSLYVRNNAAISLYNNNLSSDTSIVPSRRYDDLTLAKIADISPVVKCECPHHLAELVFSLTAFEKYTSECESLNLEDAELHAYLGNATAKARHIIETALDKVIEIENIQI